MATLDPSSSNEEEERAIEKIPGAPNTVAVPSDPTAPSQEVSSKRQSLSDVFTIVCGQIKTAPMLSNTCANPVSFVVLLGLCIDQRWISKQLNVCTSYPVLSCEANVILGP